MSGRLLLSDWSLLHGKSRGSLAELHLGVNSAARHRSVFSQSLRLLTSWLRLFSVIAPEVGLGAGFQASSGFWDDFAELEIKIAAGQEAR